MTHHHGLLLKMSASPANAGNSLLNLKGPNTLLDSDSDIRQADETRHNTSAALLYGARVGPHRVAHPRRACKLSGYCLLLPHKIDLALSCDDHHRHQAETSDHRATKSPTTLYLKNKENGSSNQEQHAACCDCTKYIAPALTFNHVASGDSPVFCLSSTHPVRRYPHVPLARGQRCQELHSP